MKNLEQSKVKKIIAAGLLCLGLIGSSIGPMSAALGPQTCCEHSAHSEIKEGVEATVVRVDGRLCIKIGDKILGLAPNNSISNYKMKLIYLDNFQALEEGDQIRLRTVVPKQVMLTGLPPVTHWIKI